MVGYYKGAVVVSLGTFSQCPYQPIAEFFIIKGYLVVSSCTYSQMCGLCKRIVIFKCAFPDLYFPYFSSLQKLQ